MFDFSDLNWWAILLSTALAFVLGGLWYGPLYRVSYSVLMGAVLGAWQ